MLQFITSSDNQLLQYIKDDPVRPELPAQFRVSSGRFVCALIESERPSAIVCVSLHRDVPASVQELDSTAEYPTVAIFYTIWSYTAGAGRQLLISALEGIKELYPSIERFVTLSPKTEMARKFHIKNGAIVLRENPETVNYEYVVSAR